MISTEYFCEPSIEKIKIIDLAEAKRKELIKTEKYLSDAENYNHHPESFYTSRSLNKLIQQSESLNISSTFVSFEYEHTDDDNSD
nr:11287_t:CDS:2 [Entrophospora candida]